MKKMIGLMAGLGLSASLVAGEAPKKLPAAPPVVRSDISLRYEIRHAIEKGLKWLEQNQDGAGHWSTADHPAVTALTLVAFQNAPDPAWKKSETLRKGYDYLAGCIQPDGGIYQKELVNYNTAVSMMALLAAQDSKWHPVILKARQFLIGLQSDYGEAGKLDSAYDGGLGYGNSERHSDMSNTLLALEALYYSKHLARDNPAPGLRDLNWDAAIHFIQSCQNLSSHNGQDWVSDDPRNKGGFIYSPGQSKAGEVELPSGRVALRSYGSISYAGLLSYIYADLDRNDPRVQAVLDWLRTNYTLEENPGMGLQGLFYYYHTLAKALTAYGADHLQTPAQGKINWREELALKLINLQDSQGFWMNENGRWWEKDKALVTAYALIALEMIERKL